MIISLANITQFTLFPVIMPFIDFALIIAANISQKCSIAMLLFLFSCSVVSDCLWPHGLQHTRLHHLPELAQTNVHWVSDAIQPSHPLSSPSSNFICLIFSRNFQNVSTDIFSEATLIFAAFIFWFNYQFSQNLFKSFSLSYIWNIILKLFDLLSLKNFPMKLSVYTIFLLVTFFSFLWDSCLIFLKIFMIYILYGLPWWLRG